MSRHDPKDAVEIVLVDDNVADQEIARRVFGSHAGVRRLHILSDGEQALDYLGIQRAAEGDKARQLPDLILMDINMPRRSGMEVLRDIKTDSVLQHIPVLMLTTSSLGSDIQDSYRLGCNSYILKPADVPEFSTLLGTLLNYWTKVATLPHRTNRGLRDGGLSLPGGVR